MNLDQLVHPPLLERMIEEGYISKKKHPTLDLYVLNYTPQTQYQAVWNDATTQCRGLIINGEGEVVSRPFPKFHNMAEHSVSDVMFNGPYLVFDKLDGSLGISYRTDDVYGIATRGSFTSDQAMYALDILTNAYPDWRPDPSLTYLWEIIYPANRIVVDYGDTEDLFLLCAIHTETGANIFDTDWPGPTVRRIEVPEGAKPKDAFAHLEADQPDGLKSEGYVFFFPNGNKRVKAKLEDYVRLHRLVFGLTNRKIWAHLKEGRSIEELVQGAPDEIFDWINVTSGELITDKVSVQIEAEDQYADIVEAIAGHLPERLRQSYCHQHRREFAALASKSPHRAAIFALLDGKSIDDYCWDLVRPEIITGFGVDTQGEQEQ